MTEHKIFVGAAALGGMSIAALFVLSRRIANPLAPRVEGFTVVPAHGRIPPLLRLTVRASAELRRKSETGNSWEYRIVDESGRRYASVESADWRTQSIDIPLGYGRPVVGPRLEVWLDESRVAQVSLPAFPKPALVSIGESPSPRIRADHQPLADLAPDPSSTWGAIRFRPKLALAEDEGWSVDVRGTSLSPNATGFVRIGAFPPSLELNLSKIPPDVLVLPYGDDVTAIHVHVARFRRHIRSERIVIAGLTLVQSGKWKSLSGASVSAANTLSVKVRLPHRIQSVSHLPETLVVLSAIPGSLHTGERLDKIELRLDPHSGVEVGRYGDGVEFLEWTGRSREVPSVLSATLVKHWSEPLGTFEVTIPVESAQTP